MAKKKVAFTFGTTFLHEYITLVWLSRLNHLVNFGNFLFVVFD